MSNLSLHTLLRSLYIRLWRLNWVLEACSESECIMLNWNTRPIYDTFGLQGIWEEEPGSTIEETHIWDKHCVRSLPLFYARASWHVWGKFSKDFDLKCECLRFEPRFLPLHLPVLCTRWIYTLKYLMMSINHAANFGGLNTDPTAWEKKKSIGIHGIMAQEYGTPHWSWSLLIVLKTVVKEKIHLVPIYATVFCVPHLWKSWLWSDFKSEDDD